MDELITWLRAQLDDDERVARAADSGRWLPEDKGITFEYRADDFHGGEAQARLVADTRANQWHIANWDPARVLAEVEAKRAILAMHAESDFPYDPESGPGDYSWTARCNGCFEDTPCRTRDGWREEWRA